MNGEIYSSNIKDLKICYIIHFILYGIIIFFNYFLTNEIFWLNSHYYYIYLSISIFGIFYFLSPIILFVYILLKKITQKRIKKYKIFSLIFCVLVILTGLFCTIILMMNALESTDFCRECPFNLDNSYIDNIYDNYVNNIYNEKELKQQCINRRCLFNNNILDNEYKYEYICNYEPTQEFDIINKNNSDINDTINQIICEKLEKQYINKYIFEREEISKFFKICNSYDDFYICQRIYEPKIYSLKDNNKCPKKNYLQNSVFLCMISVLLNLILGFIPWRVEYSKFKNMIIRLRENNNRAGSTSLNSTQNNSKVQKEEIQASYKKEPTEVIIVYNETEENMVNQINNSNDNDNDNGKKKNNNNESKNKKILNNRENINNKILDRYNIKLSKKNVNENKNNNEKKNVNEKKNNNINEKKNNEKMKNDDNSIKIFKINENPNRKKEIKKYKETENKFIRSNSYRISYYSERNIFEESKNVSEI